MYENQYTISLFVAPCILGLVDRRRISSSRSKSHILDGKVTADSQTKMVWNVNI